ncbi:hypothetical protein [Kribbella sp. NPDC051620]|uniref:hypothetical protein n=1 Tax=Kribbella sp. NPDC051620 TaxID=3364120 RepID=UPI00379292E3
MSLSNPSPRRMTRRGTRTLKSAYAQAQRDVKRMDPAVLAAVGRSKMNGQDLKHLAHANINGLYGSNHERFANQLNAQAAAQVQATTPATERTRNPFKKLANRREEKKAVRQGRYVLEQAYAQAKSEVKRIDPAVRQGIGHSRVTKQDLARLSTAQLSAPIRAGIEQAAQHHYAQARASAAAVAAQPPRQSAGQRVANAVNTASRWKNSVRDGANNAIAKAEKFRTDYNERRQNPTTRNAPTQPTAARTPDVAADKAAQAKAVHAGLNNTMPTPEATAPEAATPATDRHRAPEAAAAFDGLAPANGAVTTQTAPTGTPPPQTGQTAEVAANQPQTGSFSGQLDPAMAPAAGAVKPATQQSTTSQGQATPTHTKHQKPEGQER